MKLIKLTLFIGLLFALPVFSYFYSWSYFSAHFFAGTVEIELSEDLMRRSKKIVEVKNRGSLPFRYQIQILATEQCQFDLRIDRGDNLFYYGSNFDLVSWRRSFLTVDDSQKWTFRGFSDDPDCKMNILFRAENGFSSFAGFRFLD